LHEDEEPALKPYGPSTVASASPLGSPIPDLTERAQQIEKPAAKTDFEKRPANFFVEGSRLSVHGFTIEKRLRNERADFYERRNDPRNWAELEYVIVKQGKRVLAKFDAGLSHPLGSTASFASSSLKMYPEAGASGWSVCPHAFG
jgi:hypothetical protein